VRGARDEVEGVRIREREKARELTSTDEGLGMFLLET